MQALKKVYRKEHRSFIDNQALIEDFTKER